MNGVLNIDKPAGMTSHDVVARVRRLARLKRVGHAGTLDPDATGVLLVCLGQATRLADLLAEEGKEYRAVLALGATTTTEDGSGDVLAETDASHVTEQNLRELLPRFTGVIRQTPPMVSAVHHEGRRLYELARAGVTVERAARPVQIDALTLAYWTPGPRPQATLDVACGKGTYIRTLCADLGAALGVGGHMAALRRTRVGAFPVSGAVPLGALTADNIADHVVSPAAALAHLPAHSVTGDAQREDIRQGRPLSTRLADAPAVRVLDGDALLALARAESGRLYPYKVFVEGLSVSGRRGGRAGGAPDLQGVGGGADQE
ncbi:MAG: tRNA pseudouridine(55) synthase TruB [Armatimonadetes bacterium]|nr:tRNA pseudouridine(55) synthase TruB [Armatimonadota bacterium]